MTSVLTRIGLGFGGLLLAFSSAVVLVPQFLPEESLRAAVVHEVRDSAGVSLTVRGSAEVSLFPNVSVRLEDVVLGEDERGVPPVVAEALVGRLRLLPLLAGRLEVRDVTLERPRIAISIDHQGGDNWSPTIGRLAAALDRRTGTPALRLSELVIRDGTLVVSHLGEAIERTIHGVEAAIAWPTLAGPVAMSGRFVWQGETVAVAASVGDLSTALRGDRTGVKIRLTSSHGRLAIDGQWAARPSPAFDGAIAAESPSMRRALAWIGLEAPPGGGLGPFALKAQTRLAGRSVTLASASLALDGNEAEGQLTVSGDGPRPLVQGSLAVGRFDATPYLGGLRVARPTERGWSGQLIDLGGLGSVDLDLRLSANVVSLGGADYGRAAAALTLHDGRLGLTLGEAQAYGGRISGSLGLATGRPGAEFDATFTFTDVDLDGTLGDLLGLRRIEGRGTLVVAIEGSGATVEAMTRSLTGRAELTGRGGALVGLNVEQALRRLERRPLSNPGDVRAGRTPFERLSVRLAIVEGTVRGEEMRLESGTVRVMLGGTASIPTRGLDLRGTATLARAAGERPFELPFVVRGNWDDPVMLPDADILIRRSEAAQQLLDAVRAQRERARDAVQSAIEQIARGAAPSGEPASEASSRSQ